MSKISFRGKALKASKTLPIYLEDQFPDTENYLRIPVPQVSTGMEKEEQSEHHFQRALRSGTAIPTLEVWDIKDYNELYPSNIKIPERLIGTHRFSMDADIPDYDIDSEDELWVDSQASHLGLTPDIFEEMMYFLEQGSGQTVVTLQEAKALIKKNDELIASVYNYWLNKRRKTKHPLIPQVRTEVGHTLTNQDPYIAFRQNVEKTQLRKNRKHNESSYEKMLKLKRDMSKTRTLLELMKRREKSKRNILRLSFDMFEKRYQAEVLTGKILPKKECLYQSLVECRTLPRCSENDYVIDDNRFRFHPTSLSGESDSKFVGCARRRIGRGGRRVLTKN